jgi:hypothetical protein
MFSNFFFENFAAYKRTWKNIVQPDMVHMTVWRMRIACYIPKATNTHSECVMLIAFPLQQWLFMNATQCYIRLHCMSCYYYYYCYCYFFSTLNFCLQYSITTSLFQICFCSNITYFFVPNNTSL